MQVHRGYPAESSSLSYGLVVHLLLLPTPPLGDAVAFGYRPESICLKRTCTSLTSRALRRTYHRLHAAWYFNFHLPAKRESFLDTTGFMPRGTSISTSVALKMTQLLLSYG